MRHIRQSRHCRRIFFRYLRQRDKGKEAEKQIYRQNATGPNEKLNPQFDKFNTAISTAIVVTFFLGIISIFIHYYAIIVVFSALLLEILIAVIGAIHYDNKERKEESKTESTTITPVKNKTKTPPAQTSQITTPIITKEEPTISSTADDIKPTVILESFDMLTGVQFKDLIEKYFYGKGYSVQRITPRINSIDLIVQKGETVTAVATKMTFDLIYSSFIKKVAESAKYYNTKNITIITTSYFVVEAQQLAKEYGIMLWDREILKSKLGGLK